MAKEVSGCPGYKPAHLAELTLEEVAGLVALGVSAFEEPYFDSLRQAWELRKDQTIYRCKSDRSSGYLVIDNSLRDAGICYIELVVAHPQLSGMGTVLHKMAFNDLFEQGMQGKVVLAMTQNPAEIISFGKAADDMDYSCFPVERSLSDTERRSIEKWISEGPMSRLDPRPEVDYDRCVVLNAFRSWQPKVDTHVREGKLRDFLEANDINFHQFCSDKNAFIIGFTL